MTTPAVDISTLAPGRGSAPGSGADGPEIGDFRQGSEASRWALARYLVGRVIGDAVGTAMSVFAATLVALAVVLEVFAQLTALTVLLLVLAVGVLLVRAVLNAVMRRLAGAVFAARDARLRRLLGATRRDTLRELRRVGLPGRVLTVPLLGARLVGRRRAETSARLREFDVQRAVPAARLDELHLLLAQSR